MSTGNAGAAIGLANTNKILPIGTYLQLTGTSSAAGAAAGNANPAGSVNVLGASGGGNYDNNHIGESIGFTLPANSGATQGAKTAQWVQLGVGGLTNVQQGVTIVAGVATFSATPTHNVFAAYEANRTLPAGTYCWAFEI